MDSCPHPDGYINPSPQNCSGTSSATLSKKVTAYSSTLSANFQIRDALTSSEEDGNAEVNFPSTKGFVGSSAGATPNNEDFEGEVLVPFTQYNDFQAAEVGISRW